MIIGQTIVAVDCGGTVYPTTVYTPWVASWGNAGIFSFEIIAIGGASPSLTVKVFTKNTEDPDPGTAKGTANTQTAAGTTPSPMRPGSLSWCDWSSR